MPFHEKQRFIEIVARDFVQSLPENQRALICENPSCFLSSDLYGLYIRNHYIYPKLQEIAFPANPDGLSRDVLAAALALLLPEFDAENLFLQTLYSLENFSRVRKLYREKYGCLPKAMIEKHVHLWYREGEEYAFKVNDRYVEGSYQCIAEITSAIWEIPKFLEAAEKLGIPREPLLREVKALEEVCRPQGWDGGYFVPIQVCLVLFPSFLDKQTYGAAQDALCRCLRERPQLASQLHPNYFRNKKLSKLAFQTKKA